MCFVDIVAVAVAVAAVAVAVVALVPPSLAPHWLNLVCVTHRSSTYATLLI